MPDIRALVISLVASAAIAAYTILWWHWSVALGLGLAILIGSSALVTSVSLGADPADADEAWLQAASDLADIGTAGPTSGSPGIAEGGEA